MTFGAAEQSVTSFSLSESSVPLSTGVPLRTLRIGGVRRTRLFAMRAPSTIKSVRLRRHRRNMAAVMM